MIHDGGRRIEFGNWWPNRETGFLQGNGKFMPQTQTSSEHTHTQTRAVQPYQPTAVLAALTSDASISILIECPQTEAANSQVQARLHRR